MLQVSRNIDYSMALLFECPTKCFLLYVTRWSVGVFGVFGVMGVIGVIGVIKNVVLDNVDI